MAQAQQIRSGSWFSKGTRVENMGPGHLVFRVMQGVGENEKQIFISTIRPRGHKYFYGSDIYRNHSRENPVSVVVRLANYAAAGAALQFTPWTPVTRSFFDNAAIRIAGVENAEEPVVIEPFKGSKIGRIRAVIGVKKFWKKIRGVANAPNGN